MKAWSCFYPWLRVYCPAMPVPVLDEHLRQACIEFCERGKVWREWLEPVKTIAGLTVYDLNLDSHQDLVQLEAATLNGEKLVLTVPQDLDEDGQTQRHEPGIFAVNRTQFALTQAPTQAGLNVKTLVTIKPSLTAPCAPDALYTDYGREIAKGAVASVLMIPGEMANPALADRFRMEFDAAVNKAALDPYRNFSRARLRVKPI